MNPISIHVLRSANLIIRELLAVKENEQVMIVCDAYSEMEMVYALAGVVETVGGEFTITMMPSRDHSRKNQLTPIIEYGLEAADCLIGITKSGGAPTYSAAVKRLFDMKRLRSISMVMRSLDNFIEGGARADYALLYAEGKKVAALWKPVRSAHITSPAGTDLKVDFAGDHVVVECGYATEPGIEAAFSDGEVSQMPVEGSAEGIIVVDGPIAHFGLPTSPIRLVVEKGRVAQIEGASRQADELRQIVTTLTDADNIAEVGIGLNPACRRNGDFEEEKKARGNVHIAVGDNIFYGGTVQCSVHIDMVIYKPTVIFEDTVFVEDGNILVI